MTPPPEVPRRVDIDLTRFSHGQRRAWFTGPVVVIGLFAWFFVVLLSAALSPALAVTLFAATVLAIVIGFIVTTRQRLTRSTSGRELPLLDPRYAGERAPPLPETLGDAVRAVDAARVASRATMPVPNESATGAAASQRVRATIYIVLGVLLPLIGIPLLIALKLGGALLGPGVVVVIIGMYTLFTRARRVTQKSAAIATQDDPRPPILFLRSFQDDRVRVNERVTMAGLPSVQGLRLEEALGSLLGGFGPFIAVGEPGEGLPQLGAARAYFSEGEWQEAVLQWIRQARLIVLLCGPTRWVHWEMQNTIANGRLDRLLLVLPPGRKPGSSAAADRQERWNNIVASLAATPYAPALREVDIADVLVVQFRPDGSLLVFRSRYDLAQDYGLALTLALHLAAAGPDAVSA